LAASRPEGLLLDTHIWLRYLGISGNLRVSSLPTLQAAEISGNLYLSVYSIWETAMLVRDGRLNLNTDVRLWTQQALAQPGYSLLPFTPEIAIESVNLPEPVHKDPADRIIIATARVQNLTLVTRDKEVLAFATRNHLPHLIA
jgi:PIN domain nuclease of toxin-antitoxin system